MCVPMNSRVRFWRGRAAHGHGVVRERLPWRPRRGHTKTMKRNWQISLLHLDRNEGKRGGRRTRISGAAHQALACTCTSCTDGFLCPPHAPHRRGKWLKPPVTWSSTPGCLNTPPNPPGPPNPSHRTAAAGAAAFRGWWLGILSPGVTALKCQIFVATLSAKGGG